MTIPSTTHAGKLIKNHFKEFKIGMRLDDIIIHTEYGPTARSLVSAAFSWASTPQGYNFWAAYVFNKKEIDKQFLDALCGILNMRTEIFKKEDCM